MSNRWTLYGADLIQNGADMHTYIVPGNYACATNTDAATLKNCPLSRAFDLKVYRSAGGKTDGYIIQEYTAHDAKQRVLVPYNPYTSGTKWGNPTFLATKDDLTPTSEAIAQPLVSGITFSQWIVTAEKSGNEVTLSFNVNGNMPAMSSIVKILTLPTKYRPKSNKYVSYTTQEGYIMLLAIYADGTLNLFNNNKAVSGFILRQTISYPAE